jgi:hypothetical protein
LAMGNCVVLKPAPSTRLSALLFAELIAAAGVPPGPYLSLSLYFYFYLCVSPLVVLIGIHDDLSCS